MWLCLWRGTEEEEEGGGEEGGAALKPKPPLNCIM